MQTHIKASIPIFSRKQLWRGYSAMPSFPFICSLLLLLLAGAVSAHKPIDARKYFGYVPAIDDVTFTNQTSLAEEFLHAHNWIRKQYNLPALAWDENLASYARGYLMQRYEDCRLIHSNSKYGENIFWGKKRTWNPSDATYYWYQENQWYDFKTLTCAPPPKSCGHFTQVVWRDSNRVGCALQNCHIPDLGMLMACEYDPPGNYDNENPLQAHI